jgi:hypothetical protein
MPSFLSVNPQSTSKTLTEGFTNSPTFAPAPTTAPPTIASVQNTVSQSQVQQSQMQQNNGSSVQVNLPYYGSNPMGKSGSLQAPPYILPVSENSITQYQQAFDVAVNQDQGATASTPYPIRRVDMTKVGGYYDEELENYLTTQSLKNEQLPEPLKQTPVDLSPLTPLNTSNTTGTILPYSTLPSASNAITPAPISNITTKQNGNINYLESPQYILDLLLFIAGGILIILLCDQIFKLGMSYGMRDTVKVLMPYLKEIKITGD